MNFQFYLEKLIDFKDFIKFKKENKDAFLCSGFFSIDKKAEDNQQHLDYYIPSLNKMFSFKLDKKPIELMPVENFTMSEENTPKKIPDNLDFEFNDIEKMIEDEMKKQKINKKIEKLLWSLQNRDGKAFLVGTIFISNLGIISTTIDLDNRKISKFEKKSFFDFIKVVKKKD